MKRVLLLSDLILRIQYHQYNFFSFIDYMTLRLYGPNAKIWMTQQGTATADVGINLAGEGNSLVARRGAERLFAVEAAETEEPMSIPVPFNILTMFPDRLKESRLVLVPYTPNSLVVRTLYGESIDKALDGIGQIFVDTKFEFGYATNAAGEERMIYMDEVGTPDSSRLWDKAAHADGKVVENSKEEFRKLLLSTLPDPDVLLDKSRMAERKQVADSTDLPLEVMQQISDTYTGIAAQITGAEVIAPENPREEILEALNGYGLVR